MKNYNCPCCDKKLSSEPNGFWEVDYLCSFYKNCGKIQIYACWDQKSYNLFAGNFELNKPTVEECIKVYKNMKVFL